MTTFHTAFTPELLAFAVSKGATLEDAEDLVQLFWAAFAKTSQTQAIGAPRAWLYRALRNRITDRFRRRATQPLIVPLESTGFGESESERSSLGEYRSIERLSDFSPAADTERSNLDAEDFWTRVNEALAELPAIQAETFRRNVIDGETLGAIALDQGIPVRTAISRKLYARERLEDSLGSLYKDYFGQD